MSDHEPPTRGLRDRVGFARLLSLRTRLKVGSVKAWPIPEVWAGLVIEAERKMALAGIDTPGATSCSPAVPS